MLKSVSGYARPCVFSLHFGSFQLYAFLESCVFTWESVVFPGRFMFHLDFRIYLRLQHLRVTTDSGFVKIVHARQQQHA